MSAFIVMCRVSGGVTGTREAPLKDAQRNVRYFDTLAEAQTEATRLGSAARNPYSTADFRYWAAEVVATL